MSDILDDIVSSTHARVNHARSRTSVSDFAGFVAFERPTVSLVEALTRQPMNIIAEVKKASPSAGIIRTETSPVSIANTYEQAGAAAISVLTEPDYFGGSLSDLKDVANTTEIPVLRKDFIVDMYQIYEAKAMGADAILLIARILDKTQIAEYYDLASSLGLQILVELYDTSEIDKLDLDIVRIVGANNRNLSDMQVDIDRSISILAEIPSSIVRVSESGINSLEQIQRLVENNIHAALVGESLMRHPDPGAHLAHLLSSDSNN